MSVKQISVFLENKPGTLKKMTSVLTEHHINMRALSVVDTKDFGIVRMLVDDVYETTNVLSEANFIASLNAVLVFAIPDEVGGLDKLLQNVEAQEVFKKSEVKMWECRNCGHIVVGTKAPEICPTCAHPQSYFEISEVNY